MALTDSAWLVIEAGDDKGEFEMQAELEHQSEVTKQFIMGGGGLGQYIGDIVNQTPIPTSANEGQASTRRTGYWIDGGAGEWNPTLTFATGPDQNHTWGDGSGGTGPSNVTSLDASGDGVDYLTRMQVLHHWVAKTRTDSFGQARLHWGEWADGTYAASAGAMGAPMPVAIRSVNGNTDVREPAIYEGTLEFSHITVFPEAGVPDWLQGSVSDIFQQINDALAPNPDQ